MRDRLYALLEDGAHTVAELAGWLREDTLNVARALRQMAAEGLVVRLEARGVVTWALTGRPLPQAPTRRRRQTRQPHDRPPTQTVAAETRETGSWWVGLDRPAFRSAAASQFDRMARAKVRVKSTDGGIFDA